MLRASLTAAGFALAVAACSSISMPWANDEPVVSGTQAHASRSNRNDAHAVAIVGPFSNPQRASVSWGNIGSGLSESLRQKLQSRRDLELRADASIANAAQVAVQGSSEDAIAALTSIRERHPEVRYIVAGTVVEFSQTPSGNSAASGSAGKGAAASRNRNEATVMIDLDIIDLQARRVIARERIGGNAWAGDANASQTYSGVAFGSYRFRDTPLGLASRDAIQRAANCFERAAPPPQEICIRIVNRIEGRRVRLQSDADRFASAGDTLRVYVYDESGTKLRPVLDPQTAAQLTAKIESRGLYPSAWLQGEWPAGVAISGAVLRK